MTSVFEKPEQVSGYALHRTVTALAGGEHVVYRDDGASVAIRTEAPIAPDVRLFTLKACVGKKNKGRHVYFANGDWRARRAWLDTQAAQNGFEIITVHITDKREVIGKANPFSVDSTTFTGALKVTNQEKFSAALNRGIGKCRTFGFGFLTI